MITREEALALLEEKIKNINTFRHSLASEAVMRAVAERLGEDKDIWGLCGLMHDVDVEEVNADIALHGNVGADWLKDKGFTDEMLKAIRSHNEGAGHVRDEKLDFALAAGETITGLIVATTLVYPSQKIADVKAKSIKKRMKEKRFAASVKRENILECEKLGLDIEEFIDISLDAMKGIAEDIGL